MSNEELNINDILLWSVKNKQSELVRKILEDRDLIINKQLNVSSYGIPAMKITVENNDISTLIVLLKFYYKDKNLRELLKTITE